MLEIDDLRTTYQTRRGLVHAVDGVSFQVERGKIVGLIGESGCGKSTLARSIVRVLPVNGQIRGGKIQFQGNDLLRLSEAEMRKVRWRQIALIPQASMDSLNPVRRVGAQFEEVLVVRGGLTRKASKSRTIELAELVGLDVASLSRYPHEFSGGMKQRAVIGMALALRPSVLIADEPVTALDVIVQRQILDVIQRLQRELHLTILLITHDVSVVAQIADSVLVMYAGQLVEQATTDQFFNAPSHPYSLGLKHAFPNIHGQQNRLISIRGYPPDLISPPQICRFVPRCPFAEPKCHEQEARLQDIAVGHRTSCLRAEDMDALRQEAARPQTWVGDCATDRPRRADTETVEHSPGATLIEVRGLSKTYRINPGLRGVLSGRNVRNVYAVNDVTFSIRRGESLGLAGESGCGKTTVGKLLVKLLEPSRGSVFFDGKDLAELSGAPLKEFRRRAQLMFQNPFEALNPRFPIYRSLLEPLKIHGWSSEAKLKDRLLETLERVKLEPTESFLAKFPHEFSGGQLQRVTLARALVLEPDFLVADEPVSMLDISVRAGILNTMKDLTNELGLTSLYISHDLSLLKYTCDRIAVMYLGHSVEIGPADELVAKPCHPYTQALIAAVPVPDPGVTSQLLRIDERKISSAEATPSGCPFFQRCPEAMEICKEAPPPEITVGNQHRVNCHLYACD